MHTAGAGADGADDEDLLAATEWGLLPQRIGEDDDDVGTAPADEVEEAEAKVIEAAVKHNRFTSAEIAAEVARLLALGCPYESMSPDELDTEARLNLASAGGSGIGSAIASVGPVVAVGGEDRLTDDDFFVRWMKRCDTAMEILIDTSTANARDVLGRDSHMSLILLPEPANEVGLGDVRVCLVHWISVNTSDSTRLTRTPIVTLTYVFETVYSESVCFA